MHIKISKNILSTKVVAVFSVVYIWVFVLGCATFVASTEIVTDEAEVAPTQQEISESLLKGLLVVEAAKRDPGTESNQELLNYLKSITLSIPEMRHDETIDSIAFNPNGTWVVSGSSDGTTRVWDITTGQEIARTTVDGLVRSVEFSPDGSLVAQGACEGISEGIMACGKAVVRVWETKTGKELYQIRSKFALTSLKFMPDGKNIIMVGNGEGIGLWNLDSDLLSTPFKPDRTGAEVVGQAGTYIYGLDVDPLGRWFATGSVVAVQVWDLETAQEISKYPLGGHFITFSPDGELIASGGKDIRIWNAKTGVEVATRIQLLEGESVSILKFSPVGEKLIGANGELVRVWDLFNGLEIARINFNGTGRPLAFSPDGKRIAFAGVDNTINISLWRTEDLIFEICNLLPRNFTHEEWKQNFADEPYRATCTNLPFPVEK